MLFAFSYPFDSDLPYCMLEESQAGDMSRMVTAIITAKGNSIIDYNAGKACDVVSISSTQYNVWSIPWGEGGGRVGCSVP